MKCSYCGSENPDGATFCKSCGAPLDTGKSSETSTGNHPKSNTATTNSADSNVASRASNSPGNPTSNGLGHALITTKRGMAKFVLFSIITLGIYSLYFYYAMARDLNTICEGDGNRTAGLIQLLLLSLVTCGIYYFYWYYKFANRVRDNGRRYGVVINEGGGTVLLWLLLGSLLCGVGYFVSLHIFIRNFNTLAMAYNLQQ